MPAFDVLLYDLTSTYFEGEAQEVDKAQRGYSRDHRPDCKQIIIALVVSAEGFPLSYEVFAGNRADVTTLEEMLDAVERKHGRARRVWVFDRGIVSEENLESLRRRGASYLVGTPRAQLKAYERRLLEGDWQKVSGEVEVQPIAQDKETYVLARSRARAQEESAMRWRVVRGLMRFAPAAASAWNASPSLKPLRPPLFTNLTGRCPSNPRPKSTRPRSKMCGQPKAP